MKTLLRDLRSMTTLQKVTISLSLLLLLISLTQPAFYIDRPGNPDAFANGVFLFFLGGISFLGGNMVATLIWTANPIYFFALYLIIKGNKAGLYLSVLATAIAFSFSFLDTIMTDESGKYSAITSLESGYWLWLISFFILTIGIGISKFADRTSIVRQS